MKNISYDCDDFLTTNPVFAFVCVCVCIRVCVVYVKQDYY